MDDARFYAISTAIDEFSNADKPLVVQFSVKHEQNIDCGGAYIKLFPKGVDQSKLHGGEGEDVYNVMFGPDICGYTKRTHFILRHAEKNNLISKEMTCKSDQLTHVYTLHLFPNRTFEVLIDGESERRGNLVDEFNLLPAKEIKDPAVSKPADWVDEKMIDDPDDHKPDGYDDIPKEIVDPEATKPDDWDDEDDGEWEAPVVPNPEYKGVWRAKRIANPAYKVRRARVTWSHARRPVRPHPPRRPTCAAHRIARARAQGEWEHPMIPNPEFSDDESIGKYASFGVAAFELWQVKAGTIFDNVLICDDPAEAEAKRKATWEANKDKEKEMFDKAEEAKRAKELEEAKEAGSDADSAEDEEDDEAAEGADELKDEV